MFPFQNDYTGKKRKWQWKICNLITKFDKSSTKFNITVRFPSFRRRRAGIWRKNAAPAFSFSSGVVYWQGKILRGEKDDGKDHAGPEAQSRDH